MTHPFRFEMWVVYDHPKDHPGNFVARRWEGEEPTEVLIIDDDLDALRRELQGMGLVKLDRDPADDPVILETWL